VTEQFDAIVIGAGQSGPFLAAKLAEAGQKVAVVERKHLGGTCVNDGCTPTKTLVASARAAWMTRHATEFGVTISGSITVDMRAIKARKDAIVGASIRSLTNWLDGLEALEVIKGEGRFMSAHEVRVGHRLLSASRIFINTGGIASIPDWPGLQEVSYLTNTSIMDMEELPDHLVIAGGSYIGLEFAQMYARFGSAVTVIERSSRLASREDKEISDAIREILAADGVSFRLDTEVERVERADNNIRLHVRGGETLSVVEGTHLLLALGRTPNTADLNLEAAGIKTDKRGFIPVDDHLRTSVEGIWALGDVNGRGGFTHTSYNDYEIVADNLLSGGRRSIKDRIPVYGLFTDPPLGRIGMNEAEVRKIGKPALVAIYPMARVARARERGETSGLMKVLVDADTQRILGASILGINGDEVIHSLLQLMAADMPYTKLLETVHIHPTVSELIPTMLGGLKLLN
jgi:pyruvate/2-oxoglutarate dehydrogenase complex dihydrolipoamide dehydrogenase (E3) component